MTKTLGLILEVKIWIETFVLVLWSLQADIIRKQDGVRLLNYVASNSLFNAYLAWDFVKENFEEFQLRYGRSHSEIAEVVNSIASRFLTEIKLKV